MGDVEFFAIAALVTMSLLLGVVAGGIHIHLPWRHHQ